MDTLKQQLETLETNIVNQELFNPAISGANVGWQIEHLLLTMNMVIEQLKKSNPSNYKWRFKFSRILILNILKKIPRGRAKAPEIVKPKSYDEKSLKAHVDLTKANVELLGSLDSEKYFSHPFFGDLKVKKTIKFLEIHNEHHIKIIGEIVNSQT